MNATAPPPAKRAPRRCPACDAAPRPGLRLRGGQELLQCPACRLAWWAWEAFDPAAFYDRDYFQSAASSKGYSDYAALEPGVRRTARARLRRISRLLGHRPVRALLDLGCGTGVFLDEARRAGFEVSGVEVSPYGAAVAAERGLSVRRAALNDVELEPSSCDAVTLWDVIEHVPDPAETIARAAGALRPGGVLALSTGDVTSLCARLSGRRWHLFTLPEHLYFFSPASLCMLLQRAGLRVRRITREVNWAPLGYAVERLSKSLVGRHVRLPMGPLARLVLPATLGDVLGVYATRPPP